VITLPAEGDSTQRVLVVDNDPGVLEMVSSALASDGYRIDRLSRGDEVLNSVRETPPDLLLLDVSLPGGDGIEICRQLRDDPTTAHIPVLLMTAHRRREKRLDGISAGAQDFLLKPLDLPDLRIRVRNAAEKKRLYDESQEQLQTITELEKLRDSLVHMIVHDLKSPLTAVLGNLQLIDLFLSEDLDPNTKNAIEGCKAGAHKMDEMVSSILAVSKLESGTMELHLEFASLQGTAEDAIGLMGPRSGRVRLVRPPEEEEVHVSHDTGLIQRVIQNLLSNALDYTPKEETVVVEVSGGGERCRVVVADRGPGVPEESRELIFEKFGQVAGKGTGRKTSVGLGLAFCRLAVEAHGGRIGVESSEGGGSTFWFELPRSGADSSTPPGS
jgi:signal transduction histidine kinase